MDGGAWRVTVHTELDRTEHTVTSVLIFTLLYQRHVHLISFVIQFLGFGFITLLFSGQHFSLLFTYFALFHFIFPAYAMLMYMYRTFSESVQRS